MLFVDGVGVGTDDPERNPFAAIDDVVLDQVNCRYVPHLAVVQVGQPLVIKSSDKTLHNVHGLKGANPDFNESMAKPGQLPPRAEKSRLNGGKGEIQGRGDILITRIRPVPQQNDLPIDFGEIHEGPPDLGVLLFAQKVVNRVLLIFNDKAVMEEFRTGTQRQSAGAETVAGSAGGGQCRALGAEIAAR